MEETMTGFVSFLTAKVVVFVLEPTFPILFGGGVFPPPLQIRSRHPRESKLTRLIAYIMFYKICKFESSTIKNDLMMTSFTKNNGKIRTSAKPNKLYIIRKLLMRAIENVLFIEFEPLCQTLWAFFVKFRLFKMPAHQIWSCHVAQDANFKKFLFCPNSSFNIRKSHKISSGKALYVRSYQPKTSQGVENNPPSPFRIK